MKSVLPVLFCAVLVACGAPKPKPRFEGNPDWIGRASGVFPAPGGAGLIEGIAAAGSASAADAAACAEVSRILAKRLVAMLPATEDAATIPHVKLMGQRITSRWQRPEGGPAWSLCVLDRAGVSQSLSATQMTPSLRDFLSVQVEQILQ